MDDNRIKKTVLIKTINVENQEHAVFMYQRYFNMKHILDSQTTCEISVLKELLIQKYTQVRLETQ